MYKEHDLNKFAEDLHQEVISRSNIEGKESFREDAFTELMIEYLYEAQELDDVKVFSYRATGMQVNGYSVSEDEECLDLVVTIYESAVPPVKIGKRDVEIAVKRVVKFFTKSLGKLYNSLEESSDAYDLAQRIYELKDSLTKVRVYLVTDGITKLSRTEDTDHEGIQISYHIWDVERLYRFWSSGQQREIIKIDFESDLGQPIMCLPMPVPTEEYTSYLLIIKGDVLARLYEKYGPRLLERNVRSFLQARGNVNKGIRNTILNEPQMFLAYNNGISATAEKVEIVDFGETIKGIKMVQDFQIVNGGQTTASIYTAYKKDKADISKISVQVKLTVVSEVSKMNEIVPKISEYANSQNKVQTADFSANDPFHQKIEELSRTIWAPAANGSQRQTRWFYERARGQYMDEKGRQLTRAQKKIFEMEHPSKQKFSKTDLAKFENTWNQLPYNVSKGAQYNFKEFTINLKERGGYQPDQKYFEHLIAKAILFRETEKLVQAQNYGGYRANIVTYTLAWLSYLTAQRIDLDKIWREQTLSLTLQKMIISLSWIVWEHIINALGGANVTEWCKKPLCWSKLTEKSFKFSKSFEEELISAEKQNSSEGNRGIKSADPEDLKNIKKVMEIPAETWFNIASWAKETNNLKSWQRSISFSLGRLAATKKTPSWKQARQGLIILEEVQEIGFIIDKSKGR